MNYVFIHIGDYPAHLKFSINAILSVDKDSKIFLLGNKDPKLNNVNFFNLDEIKSEKTLQLIRLNIYEGTSYDVKINPLWETSLLRIFYLNDFLSTGIIENAVHFDSDVIIYESLSEIRDLLKIKKINITEHINDIPIFGFSYLSQNSSYQVICNELLNYLITEYVKDTKFKDNPLNEMKLLGMMKKKLPSFFNILPSLPYDGSNYLFDPATYGQYLGGSHVRPKKIFRKLSPEMGHRIGPEIFSKRIKVYFKNSKPIVVFRKKSYTLVNLHVHSKKLQNFLPKNYKNYISF